MKIGYFADGPWSHGALELISRTPELEIVFIVPRYDVQDPILKKYAEKLKVPFIPHKNVNSKEFLSLICKYKVDLFVSMSFNQILKRKIIESVPLGFINCHAGALPFYRGRNPLNWVLINGEDKFGITVHYVDEGIDTGDILEQQFFEISETDNYKTLLERAISECANVLYKAILKIFKGSPDRTKQEEVHPVGTYFGRRVAGDEVVDFNWGAKRFFNFVRAITFPGPCARCCINEDEYAIISCELIKNAPDYIATTGEIVGKNQRGSIVKVHDKTILITSMAKVYEEKLQSIFIPSFRIGTRFLVNSN